MSRASVITTGFATGVFTLAFAGSSWWPAAAVSLLVGLLSLMGQRAAWSWSPSAVFIGFTSLAATGVFLDLPPLWMLAGMVCALVAWDVDHFARRARFVRQADQREALARAHFQRLGAVAALGLIAGGIALNLQVRLSFAVALFLGLLVIFGLTRSVGSVQRNSRS